MMKAFLRAMTAIVCLTLGFAPGAQAYDLYSRNPFKQRWIGYHQELTAEHLNRLFEVMESDAKTAQMLGELKRMTGHQSAFELLALIHLCYDEANDFQLQLRGPDVFGRAATDGSDRSICLSRGLNLGDALGTFIHELTHFLRMGAFCSSDPKRYKDVDSYSLATILEPGDEVDAFLTEYSARIRIEHSRTGIPYLYREMFSDSGQYLGTREEFGRLLLSTPAYKSNFSQRYEICKARLPKK